MKLTLELIPDTASGSSLYRLLTEKAWKAIRVKVLEEYNSQCVIYGANAGRLNCHKQWEYDDQTNIQRLVRLVILCPMCHLVKNMNTSYVSFEELVQHFMRVNECSRQDFDEYYQQSREEQIRRGSCKYDEPLPMWEQDFGEYSAWISQKGNLKRKYE